MRSKIRQAPPLAVVCRRVSVCILLVVFVNTLLLLALSLQNNVAYADETRSGVVNSLPLGVNTNLSDASASLTALVPAALDLSCDPASIEVGISCNMDWMCGLDPCLCGTPDSYGACACNGLETIAPSVTLSSSDESVLRVAQIFGRWYLLPISAGQADVSLHCELLHYADTTQTMSMNVAPAGALQWLILVLLVLVALFIVACIVIGLRQLIRRAARSIARRHSAQCANSLESPTPKEEKQDRKSSWLSSRRRVAPTLIGLSLILVLAFAFSLALGRFEIDFGQLISTFGLLMNGSADETAVSQANIFFGIRAPRIVAAVVVGASLAAAGCAYQGIFKNPMVSPDLLGASAGACFGAALGILLSFSNVGIEIIAFVMGVVAVCVTCFISSSISMKMNGILVLVLSGMVVSNVFTALVSAVKFVADPNSQLPDITFWLMGGLSAVRESDLLWLVILCLIGTVGLFALRWRLNVMALGDEEALSLGVDVKRTRSAVVICATLLTAASVAVAGMVGWVGLIIPHLARFLVGPDHRWLMPASMLLGASFLVLVDDLCRSLYTTEIPLSIITALVGAPLFVYLICKQRKL